MKTALLAFLSLLMANFAYSATRVWTGASSCLWSEPSNWGGTAPVAGDDLVFGDAKCHSVINDYADGTPFHSISFPAQYSYYSLRGNRIALGAGGWIQNHDDVDLRLSITLTHSQTWTASIGGLAGLMMFEGVLDLGANMLTITGPAMLASTIGTGGLTVEDGWLSVGRMQHTGPTTLQRGGRLWVGGPDPLLTPIVVNDGGELRIPGCESGLTFSAPLTLNPGGQLWTGFNCLPQPQYYSIIDHGTITLHGDLWICCAVGTPDKVFTLIHNVAGNPVVGTFAGYPEGATYVSEDGHKFKVSYLGGAGHDVTLTYLGIPTTTTLHSSCNPSSASEEVTLTATVAPNHGGSVTFFDSGKTLATVGVDGTGCATLKMSNLVAGTHAITATYAGDDRHSSSTSPVLYQSVSLNAAIPALDPRVLVALGSLLIAVAVAHMRR